MAKQLPKLDTPFRPGEKVVTTRPIQGVRVFTPGKVKLVNGIGPWMRYWVRFSDGSLGRQIDHDDLTRPGQIDEWTANAERLAAEAAKAKAPAKPKKTGASDKAKSRIPAALLERSKAGKAKTETTDTKANPRIPAALLERSKAGKAKAKPDSDTPKADTPKDDAASRIPAALLERSKAGKAKAKPDSDTPKDDAASRIPAALLERSKARKTKD